MYAVISLVIGVIAVLAIPALVWSREQRKKERP